MRVSVGMTIFKENYDEYGCHLESDTFMLNHPKNTDSIDLHTVKCVRIQNFSGQDVPTLGLNKEIYRDSEFIFSPNVRKCRPEHLQIRTLFLQLISCYMRNLIASITCYWKRQKCLKLLLMFLDPPGKKTRNFRLVY